MNRVSKLKLTNQGKKHYYCKAMSFPSASTLTRGQKTMCLGSHRRNLKGVRRFQRPILTLRVSDTVSFANKILAISMWIYSCCLYLAAESINVPQTRSIYLFWVVLSLIFFCSLPFHVFIDAYRSKETFI